ncbi:L-serine ammonia-lyase, iron-sulfur-dependent subunit beta [Cohnella nanjingensis]|uniref:L-serine deaminase n=1 Tax=Cohnella nanjingensis TaxID=1387779 RepID=A0A7X0RNX4_9BACL|nr:L-serine ammonia-lyase, iron-sulfur-dependent subunit beta [Cohnella nanjingensis]MBB6669544.1 L-serine ammonia-lyase, iron-sulfur-dependent, subunit beta [Cohnella nanjingensis]
MRFKDVFSIIGPAMVGPSSSHTAGAARLGRIARQLLAEPPLRADITFYGSFADTYRGHGTDLAVVGGLLDYDTDDARIPDSLAEAKAQGLEVAIGKGSLAAIHPNTVTIKLTGRNGAVEMTGCSIGGGNVAVAAVNGFSVSFSGASPTLIVRHSDRPGTVAAIASTLEHGGINIATMTVDRKGRNGEALSVLETDQPAGDDVLARLRQWPAVLDIRVVQLTATASEGDRP